MLAPFFSDPAFKCVSRAICISDRRLRASAPVNYPRFSVSRAGIG